tara:strand:- start:507 stop:671 length:165 start_codon:yes stop_codon:yes gene_type:complete
MILHPKLSQILTPTLPLLKALFKSESYISGRMVSVSKMDLFAVSTIPRTPPISQ